MPCATPAKQKAYMRAYNRKRRRKLRAKCLCVDCGDRGTNYPHVICEECLLDRRVRGNNGKVR
jgi:hypothetical protein